MGGSCGTCEAFGSGELSQRPLDVFTGLIGAGARGRFGVLALARFAGLRLFSL